MAEIAGGHRGLGGRHGGGRFGENGTGEKVEASFEVGSFSFNMDSKIHDAYGYVFNELMDESSSFLLDLGLFNHDLLGILVTLSCILY